MATMKASALIAEDEPLLAESLKQDLARLWPELTVVNVVGDGQAAVQQALGLRPEVVFLDIRMPGLNGLEAAQVLSEDWPTEHGPCPLIVFVTAYDQHALDAFEQAAVDYVLKPVDDARLAQTLARLRARTSQSTAPDTAALARLLAGLAPARPAPRPIQAGVGREVVLIPPEEIVYFEADQRYTRVVHQGGDALIRTPLRELLTQLDPEQFWQIHRSVLVNSRCIARAIRVDEGTMVVTLRGRDERLPVSRQFQGLFKGQ